MCRYERDRPALGVPSSGEHELMSEHSSQVLSPSVPGRCSLAGADGPPQHGGWGCGEWQGLTHSPSCQSTCREDRLFLPDHRAMRVSWSFRSITQAPPRPRWARPWRRQSGRAAFSPWMEVASSLQSHTVTSCRVCRDTHQPPQHPDRAEQATTKEAEERPSSNKPPHSLQSQEHEAVPKDPEPWAPSPWPPPSHDHRPVPVSTPGCGEHAWKGRQAFEVIPASPLVWTALSTREVSRVFRNPRDPPPPPAAGESLLPCLPRWQVFFPGQWQTCPWPPLRAAGVVTHLGFEGIDLGNDLLSSDDVLWYVMMDWQLDDVLGRIGTDSRVLEAEQAAGDTLPSPAHTQHKVKHPVPQGCLPRLV